jgi:hypothetical protein
MLLGRGLALCTPVDLLALLRRDAKVVANMRTLFDHLGKQMTRSAIEATRSVETDAEVSAETRRVDLVFSAGDPVPGLGLLSRIVNEGAGTFEFFHKAPSSDELTMCVNKHGALRHNLERRNQAMPLPIQWVISSGRPQAGIKGLGFRPLRGWPRGLYETVRLLWTRLVVVNELPVKRDTLLLRLLGAGAVFKRAIAQLSALPPDARERQLALPVLVSLRLSSPDPAHQTADEQEFFMATQDIVEAWRQKAIEEGEQQGVQRGKRELLLHLLRLRFGAQVTAEVEHRMSVASVDQLEAWAERAMTGASLAELLAR